jgi:hypothetical protein
MTSELGLDDDVDGSKCTPEGFLAVLSALEEFVQRPGLPQGLTVSQAMTLGYLTRQHVLEAVSTVVPS